MDRLIRQEYQRDVAWLPDRARKVHMGGLYRLFNATMMIGISLLLDPNSPEAPEHLAILDEFIEQHRTSDFPDFCSKREVKIIELFRAKARDPSWCAATAITGAKKKAAANGGGGGAGDDASAASNPVAGSHGGRVLGPPVSSLRTEANTLLSQATPPDNSSTSSHDNDLAQTIFDQLGGLENFGLYKNPEDPMDGTLAPQPMTLDLNSGLDEFIDFWSDNNQAGGAGVGATADPTARGDVKPGPTGMTPSHSQLGATGNFAGTFDAFSSPVPPPTVPAGAPSSSAATSGQAGIAALGKGAMSVSFAPPAPGAPVSASGNDSTLIPWGGLIEAIAPLNANGPTAGGSGTNDRKR